MPDAAAAGPAIGEILGREFFGVKLGLEPMRRLCAGLNHPERAYATIIVAGTNGKGSVAAIAAHALSEAGYRTGRYTSPHLVSIAERFVVAGAPLPPDALEDAASSVLAAEASGLAGGGITLPMTFFELGTATAFEAFRRAGVEVAVVEVGLGGRLDATNVVSPVAAAITSIDFDHQQHLGDTLAAIAREKAGVARPGVPLVTGPMRAEPLEAIRAVASEIGAPLIDAASTIQTQWQMGADGRTHLRLRTPHAAYGPLVLSLRGAHQVANAAVAVALLESVRLPPPGGARGGGPAAIPVGTAAILAGLSGASWPGRLDLRELPGGRAVLLDAAHNAAGAASLAAYLEATGMARLPIVFGVMRDKACVEMLRALAPVASSFVFTQVTTARARPATELPALAREAGVETPCEVAPGQPEALRAAWRTADRICVCGSIFLVGEVLSHLPAGGA